ncbi:hypothetical protein BaRGS_00035042, partial [Batillaria attramentaria]
LSSASLRSQSAEGPFSHVKFSRGIEYLSFTGLTATAPPPHQTLPRQTALDPIRAPGE